MPIEDNTLRYSPEFQQRLDGIRADRPLINQRQRDPSNPPLLVDDSGSEVPIGALLGVANSTAVPSIHGTLTEHVGIDLPSPSVQPLAGIITGEDIFAPPPIESDPYHGRDPSRFLNLRAFILHKTIGIEFNRAARREERAIKAWHALDTISRSVATEHADVKRRIKKSDMVAPVRDYSGHETVVGRDGEEYVVLKQNDLMAITLSQVATRDKLTKLQRKWTRENALKQLGQTDSQRARDKTQRRVDKLRHKMKHTAEYRVEKLDSSKAKISRKAAKIRQIEDAIARR